MKDSAYKICIHCGTPFSGAGRRDSEFCCNGCEYVHRLIHKEGLDQYYQLKDRRIAPVQSAALHPRDYTWLEKWTAGIESGSGKTAEGVLDLEGISCVGCVWLLEKLFRQRPGALRIEINTQYGQVRLQWRRGVFKMVDYAREIQRFGYILGPPGERPQQESRRLLGKIGLCAAFAMNATLFTLPRYLGMDKEFVLADFFELLSLTFATLALLAGGSYFIRRGFKGLLAGVLHIDFPIALGILFAWAGSLLGWIIGDNRFLYFDFVAVFIFLMLIGRWLQERALEKNRHQLLSHNRTPREVHVIGDDLESETTEPVALLEPGQRLRILPGEVVPVHGELESREAAVSLEWINGESTMRSFKKGQWVPAGAQNIGIEPVLVIARQKWENSLLNKLLSTMAVKEGNRLMDRILRVYLFVVLFIAAVGATGWLVLAGDRITALQVLLSVLVVSCPCALGVAYPLAQEWAVIQLRKYGVFVRNGLLFQKLGKVRKAVFDKTGTLTLEAPELSNPESLENLEDGDRLILREVVKTSLHPVSRALREALLQRDPEDLDLPPGLQVREEIGMGLIAESGDSVWTLGRPEWRADEGKAAGFQSFQCGYRKNGKLLAGFNFAEALREETIPAIKSLRKHLSITILSGDRISRVKELARKMGLPDSAAIGEQSPGEKADFLEKMGSTDVLYIGDGANDALAFAMATARGTPATPHGLLQDKADFFFTGRSLKGILQLFAVQRLRAKAVRASFIFAILYNVVVVLIALSGKMHPLLAAILMPLSSLVTLSMVAIIYQRGRRLLEA